VSQELEDDDERAYVTVTAFGHRFDDYPAGLAEELISLEQEGAIYKHFGVEPVRPDDPGGGWTFRYYRVALTPPEIFGYVEASIAYKEFGRRADELAVEGRAFASKDEWLEACLDGVIDPELADRVRRYGNYGRTRLKDGTVADIRGCHASFYPQGLDELLMGQRPERYEELPDIEARDSLALVMRMLNNLNVSARVLGNRQRSRPAFDIANEYDLQDFLFALLRSVFDDARREEWTPQRAASAKRIDVVLPDIGVVLEAKFVRDANHAKRVADELRIDFECYHDHPSCGHLLALVWDPTRHIADPAQFSNDLSGLRQKNGKSFEVTVLVR
jgi:hypothetical protein